jgi:hypothetical protein
VCMPSFRLVVVALGFPCMISIGSKQKRRKEKITPAEKQKFEKEISVCPPLTITSAPPLLFPYAFFLVENNTSIRKTALLMPS